MAENFFWTFLLLAGVCFVLVLVSHKEKFAASFYASGFWLFVFLTLVSVIGWIWS